MEAPIPQEWLDVVLRILREGCFGKEILFPKSVFNEWQAHSLGAFIYEVREPIITALSVPGVVGKFVPDQPERTGVLPIASDADGRVRPRQPYKIMNLSLYHDLPIGRHTVGGRESEFHTKARSNGSRQPRRAALPAGGSGLPAGCCRLSRPQLWFRCGFPARQSSSQRRGR